MTPEERLFRIIDNPSTAAGATTESGMRPLISGWIARFGNWNALRQWFMEHPIRRLNLILTCLLAVLLAYLVVDVAMASRRYKKYAEVPVTSSSPILSQEAAASAGPSVDEYLTTLKNQDVFRTATMTGSSSNKGVPVPASPLEGFKLVGISWGTDPEAIINDTRSNKTFFVKPGNRVGALTIREITRESVILTTDGGETHELR